MKAPAFDYAAPTTVEEALDVMGERGDGARFLAGGQSLVPLMNQRQTHPAVLVDLNRVAGLDDVTLGDGVLRVGAMVRQQTLCGSAEIASRAPLLAEAASHVGHLPVRHRGTIGGSLAFGDPNAELPAAALALDASVVLRAREGARTVALDELYDGPFTTTIRPDELLVAVEIPLAGGARGHGFVEVSRREQDPAMAGAAVVLDGDGHGGCHRARIALCGVARTPVRVPALEEVLAGTPLGELDAVDVGEIVDQVCDPLPSVHASPPYRRHLAGVVARRAIEAARDHLEREDLR